MLIFVQGAVYSGFTNNVCLCVRKRESLSHAVFLLLRPRQQMRARAANMSFNGAWNANPTLLGWTRGVRVSTAGKVLVVVGPHGNLALQWSVLPHLRPTTGVLPRALAWCALCS